MRRVNDVLLAKVLAVGKTGVSTTLNAVREPYEAKVSSTVLRGPRLREAARLPSSWQQTRGRTIVRRLEASHGGVSCEDT
jgi:hypothetical protein